LWQVPPDVKAGKYEIHVDVNMGPFATDNTQPSIIEI